MHKQLKNFAANIVRQFHIRGTKNGIFAFFFSSKNPKPGRRLIKANLSPNAFCFRIIRNLFLVFKFCTRVIHRIGGSLFCSALSQKEASNRENDCQCYA